MERGGLFIPLALGQVFLNCPLPTHLQLTYSRFRGKITRLEVYKSDLLTYSHFTRTLTPDEGLRVLRGTSEVTALKVPSSSDQASPSFPKAIHLVPKILIFKLVLLSDYSSPSATRR